MRKRALLIGAGIVATLAVGGAFAIAPMLRSAVERSTAEALGTARLASASFAPLQGQLTLRGLWIGNAAGFPSPYAVAADEIAMTIAMPSLLGDVIEVETMEIRGLRIVLETDLAHSNLGSLADHAAQRRGDGHRVRIAQIRVTSPVVRVVQTAVGTVGTSLSLPDIELRDIGIGGDQGSATTGAVIDAILDALRRNIAGVADRLPAEIARVVTDVGAGAGDALQHVEKAAGDVGSEIEKGIGGAVRQIEKLFK